MAKSKKIDENVVDTIIGEGATLEGKLTSQASIRVDGKMIGEMEGAGDITIGERGNVQASLTARDVIIEGTVHGNVTALRKLNILSKGRLEGNTKATSLVIDEGGTFLGTSKMEPNKQVSSTQSALEKENHSAHGTAQK